MKDSQLLEKDSPLVDKYIKANNERFSTIRWQDVDLE